MKTLRQTFTLLFALISFTGLLAQTAEERKFTETVDSLNKQLSIQHDARNYQACETLTRSIIELYQTHADQLSEGYSYFKYAGYYNLACVQAKLGKKKEAVASLMEALEDGKLEISYKQVTNDSDLESIIHADELKPLLNKLREKTDYLYILKKHRNMLCHRRLTPCRELPTQRPMIRIWYASDNTSDWTVWQQPAMNWQPSRIS